MTVRITSCNADGSVVAFNDETGHTGTVPATQIGFVSFNGVTDYAQLRVPCPDGCGIVSIYPPGGGAMPAAGQELYARTIARLGCPCPSPLAAGKPLVITQSHAKLHAERTDWVGRWAIAGSLK